MESSAWWQMFSPRRHLAAAIGWPVFVVVALAALVAAEFAAHHTEQRLRQDRERLLNAFASQVRDWLASELGTRVAILRVVARRLDTAPGYGAEPIRQRLLDLQRQFPEMVALVAADAQGRVLAATQPLAAGSRVDGRSWFREGRQMPYAAGSGEGVNPAGGAVAAIDLAVPLAEGAPGGGALGARLSWTWLDRLGASVLGALDGPGRLELWLALDDGRIVLGPARRRGEPIASVADWSDGGRMLVGQPFDGNEATLASRWTVVVREDRATALADAERAYRSVFLSVLAAGRAAAAAAVLAAGLLTRRLRRLAQDAAAVRSGAAAGLEPLPGHDEVAGIGVTLAELVAQLQGEKQALIALNAELDERVADRTARIERLADEARHAAIARERLRLARELHDTLAHSLMALLTQIRLVRKLTRRPVAGVDLDEELQRAEAVAATGLAEARAAIGQMRHNGVREAGLGMALAELVQRFGRRTGIITHYHADPEAAGQAGERAEIAFRILEEALHNVERHAQAGRVEVRVEFEPGRRGAAAVQAGSGPRVRLTVCDDGIGFDPDLPVPGHYGLRGIAEQAALMQAQWQIDSSIGAGTRLTLVFAL